VDESQLACGRQMKSWSMLGRSLIRRMQTTRKLCLTQDGSIKKTREVVLEVLEELCIPFPRCFLSLPELKEYRQT